MNHPRLLGLGLLAFLGAVVVTGPRVVGDDAKDTPDQAWIRIDENDDRVVHLDVAARTLTKGEGAPTITLNGAVHIGEHGFYKGLQEDLDQYDLVLFEGVNPPGSGEIPANLSGKQRAKRTESRMRLVAILLERYRADHEAYPDSLDNLAASLAEHPRQANWLAEARTDAWGNPIGYTLSDDGTFDLVSLGSDGQQGGKRSRVDLRFSDQKPLSESELGVAPGIQKRLAETFRLRFQLDEMDETRPNWRNADMNVDELEERLGAGEGEEGQGTILFDLLDGSSAMAHMASFVLGVIEQIPGAAPRGRLMIMEMLSIADESMLAASMPGGEHVIDVIIGDRNQVVVDRLKQVLSEEPEIKRIAVIYGAGHMPDLEERIEDQLGYTQTGKTTWRTAMRLPLERVGISEQERMLLRATLIRQLAQAKAARGK